LKLTKAIKALLLCGSVLGLILWATSTRSSQAVSSGQNPKPVSAVLEPTGYVGSDACKDCHEDQFKNYSHTSHAELAKLSSWKKKVTGCESCHGPGKAHAEEGDPAKIISFKNKSSKEVSETCLTCHAGREEHNNFRRGEHWRNDIGCTDCHSPHQSVAGKNLASSNVFVTSANAEKPGFSTVAMLKMNDPQLCLGCNT
jgi:hypothetical protein